LPINASIHSPCVVDRKPHTPSKKKWKQNYLIAPIFINFHLSESVNEKWTKKWYDKNSQEEVIPVVISAFFDHNYDWIQKRSQKDKWKDEVVR
jgi:hypothetical protein